MSDGGARFDEFKSQCEWENRITRTETTHVNAQYTILIPAR